MAMGYKPKWEPPEFQLPEAKAAEPRFAVCYRNKPQYKGCDSFLRHGNGETATSSSVHDAIGFTSLAAAIAAAISHPIHDDAHEQATVVKVTKVERVEITEVTDL